MKIEREDNMKKKIFNLALIFLLIINISAVLTMIYNKWLRVYPYEQAGEPAVPLLKDELKLSEAQAANLETSRLSFEKELENVDSLLTEKRMKLFELIRASQEPDTDEIDKLIDEIAELQSSIQKKAVRNLVQEKNSLTPEQQQKYLSTFESRLRKGWMQGRGRYGQGRGMGRGRQGRGPGWQRELRN